MTGKICVVTGANAGIGRAVALGLSKMGATVIMLCRDQDRGSKALEEIKKSSGNESLYLFLADLSSKVSIRKFASDLLSRFDVLDVLINNAAVIPQLRTVTVDGLETQFAVNYLAGFQLTELLMDALRNSDSARVVNVSSNAHKSSTLNFADLQSEQSYDAQKVYQQTKLANILFTYELARRLADSNVNTITANCLHPGVIATKLLSDYSGAVRGLGFLKSILFGDAARGAETPLYLATSSEVEGVSGKYFDNRKIVKSSAASHDLDAAGQLWRLSEKLSGD